MKLAPPESAGTKNLSQPPRATAARILRDPRLLFGVAFSAVLTWLALRGIEPSQLVRTLRSMEISTLFAAIVLTFFLIWFRALRWRLLLLAVSDVSRTQAFHASVIGYMMNYVLPVRIGEVVRAYLVATRQGFSRSAAFATVILERLVDIFSVLIIFAFVMLVAPLAHLDPQLLSALRASAGIFLFVGVFVIIGLWVAKRYRHGITTSVEAIGERWLPALARQSWRVGAFAQGIRFRSGPWLVSCFLFHTVVIWTATALQIQVLAMGFDVHLSWEATCLLIVGLAIGVSLPSAPGLVGTFHYAVVLVLLGFGIARPVAVSYAVVLHAVTVLPILGLGLILVWFQGLSIRTLVGVQHPLSETSSQARKNP